MFVASYLTFMTIGGFPSFIEDMKVCFGDIKQLVDIFTFLGKE